MKYESKRDLCWHLLLVPANLVVLFALLPALGCSDSRPAATQSESAHAAPTTPTIAFGPDALKEIQRIVQEQQLDWAEVVIYLAADDGAADLSGLKMTFERRDGFPADSHIFAKFDGISVVISKKQVSLFQNVRVTMGERNAVRCFVFEKSPR